MQDREAIRELIKIAKSLVSAETFKYPECGSKVLNQTNYCVKCKKKVKEAGKVKGSGNPDGTGPMKDTEDCPYNEEED